MFFLPRSLALRSRAHQLVRAPYVRALSSEISNGMRYMPRRERWITPTMVAVGLIPLLSFGLGTWQLQRLRWKIDLIDELQEKLQMEPLSLPSRINLSAIPTFMYRKVLLKGRWDHEHSLLLGPRVREGTTGFHLITPLIRENGSTVLVDRGFVPKDSCGGIRARTTTDQEVEVLGLLRTGHARNKFTPDNQPETGIWHWVDLDAMAEYAGGTKADVQAVLVEEIFEGNIADAAARMKRGIPVGRPPTVDLRNAHLSYVITWYSLSAVTAAMFIRLLLKRRAFPGRPLPR